MRHIAPTKDPIGFFKYYLVRVCDEASVSLKDRYLQVEYLSRMLSRFVEPERHFRGSADPIWVVDVLKETLENLEVDLEIYREAADKILFYQSFYPEVFKRRRMDQRFYTEAAKKFYSIVGSYQAPVCGMISMEYSLWNFVLKTAKVRYMF